MMIDFKLDFELQPYTYKGYLIDWYGESLLKSR
jgi:hypothetical protein